MCSSDLVNLDTNSFNLLATKSIGMSKQFSIDFPENITSENEIFNIVGTNTLNESNSITIDIKSKIGRASCRERV